MPLTGKNGSKKTFQQDEVHRRTKYIDHSLSFLTWVNALGLEKSYFGRLFQVLDEKYSLRRVGLIFLFSLGLSFILYTEFDYIGDYDVGDVAFVDIKSPFDLQIKDEITSEARRIEAEQNMPLIMDYEVEAFEPVYSRIYKAFREMRVLVAETEWPDSGIRNEEKIKDFFIHKSHFEEELGIEVPDLVFEWLVRNRFNVRIENILIGSISRWSREMIIDVPDSLLRGGDRALLVRELRPGGNEYQVSLDQVINLRHKENFSLEGLRDFDRLAERDQENLSRLAHLLVVPNVSLNKQEMAQLREKARDSVLDQIISVRRNQVIVSAGSTVQPNHLAIINEISSRKAERRSNSLAIISSMLFVLVVVTCFTFLRRSSRNRLVVETKDIFVMGFITLLIVVISKFFTFLTESALLDRYGELIPQGVFTYLAPIAAGPMLVGLLIYQPGLVWVFIVFLSTIMAAMFEMDITLFVVSLLGGVTAAHGVVGCTNRNDIYWAGIRTGFVNAIAVVFMYSLVNMGQSGLLYSLLWVSMAGFVAGILSAFVALMFIPMLESMFSYTTDLKLLELSNLNHPLMQELMMKAPGTYHHCISVGNMVDSAAREIGANPLLAKVMAYYHDIGKMEHSQYFIENQRPGHNPHDYVSPHMSKTILIAHVKDGAEMAIRHKLGKPIVDGILQHHGTTLISYFYNKALEEEDDDVTGHIEESDFRYPGPKPQFKEAAIVMLADSIEATARSLEEPTAGRLNSIVENIVESKFMDGQLDECNLTVKDLSLIKVKFKKILKAIYHQRMDYPHMKDGKVITVNSKKGGKKGSHTA